MKFRMTFTQEFVVEAESAEVMKKAAKDFQTSLPFLYQFKLDVVEAADDEGDGRWHIVNGRLDRKPLIVETIEALRAFEAPNGEIAKVASESRTYVYQKAIDPNIARQIDLSLIVASKHGGVWIDMVFVQRQMQAQAQRGGSKGLQGPGRS